jgi:hypothetical protein
MAAAPWEDSLFASGAHPDSWARLVRSFLGTPHEPILHEIKRGNVLHYDMNVYPERGDALDHFHEAGIVVAEHLYYDDYTPDDGFFYNVKNNEIVERAQEAGVPLFLLGDYPLRARRPDFRAPDWRLYLP